MPTFQEVQEAPLKLALIRDLPMVTAEEIDSLRLWKELRYQVPHEDLVFYGEEVRAIVSIGRTQASQSMRGADIDMEFFLVVTIPLWGHVETSRRIRMYDQMDYPEFLEKEVRTWEPLDLSTGEVVAFWGEQIPSPEDLALELIEDEYQGTQDF